VKVIYKYYLSSLQYICNGVCLSVRMPEGAVILHAGVDRDSMNSAIWAIVEPAAPEVQRTFVIYGTGWDIENLEKLRHLSTFSYENLVFHVFEIIGEELRTY
jgi:hypothetical protein